LRKNHKKPISKNCADSIFNVDFNSSRSQQIHISTISQQKPLGFLLQNLIKEQKTERKQFYLSMPNLICLV